MTERKRSTKSTWVDPDDAPEWTDEMFASAERRDGDKVTRPASGTVARPRGRPPVADKKETLSVRVKPRTLADLKARPNWNGELTKAIEFIAGGGKINARGPNIANVLRAHKAAKARARKRA